MAIVVADLAELVRALGELEFTSLAGVTNSVTVILVLFIGASRIKRDSTWTLVAGLLALLTGVILLMLVCMSMVGFLLGENLPSSG